MSTLENEVATVDVGHKPLYISEAQCCCIINASRGQESGDFGIAGAPYKPSPILRPSTLHRSVAVNRKGVSIALDVEKEFLPSQTPADYLRQPADSSRLGKSAPTKVRSKADGLKVSQGVPP